MPARPDTLDRPAEGLGPSDGAWFAKPFGIVLLIAGARLLVMLLTASRYGYFGDELYLLAGTEHLDWGYVDHPPLLDAAAWIVRHTLGDSLLALHFVPALCGSLLVCLTALIARELGGGCAAMWLSGLCVACAGVYLTIDHLFTMNSFEPLFWMGCAWLMIRIIKTGNQRLWVWFGVLAGFGLLNKYSMAFFGAVALAAVLLTPLRRSLAHRWIWIGGAIALAIFLPNLVWNIRHHFPFIEVTRNVRASGRDVVLGPLPFVVQQILMMNPASFPMWFAGIFYLFFGREVKAFRVLGWMFLGVLGGFMILHGKDYYVAPIYPAVLAAGAVAFERFVNRTRQRWLQPAFASALLGFAAIGLPMCVPVLSPGQLVRYLEEMPFKPAATEKSHMNASLPHHFAWSFGWEEMVANVARMYHGLPPEQRAKTAIFGNNFAEAGAVDFFGPRYGLPKAIGGHQNYWLWGPRNYTGESVIVIGDSARHLRELCEQVEVGPTIEDPYARPVEKRPILLCRGLKWNLRQNWPQVKSWR